MQQTKEQIKEEFIKQYKDDYIHGECEEGCCGYLPDLDEYADFFLSKIDSLLQSQEDELVEKIKELDFFKRFDDKDYSPQIPREVLKQEIITLIKQDK